MIGMMIKEIQMIRDTIYVSPVFGTVSRIPAAALTTYVRRDKALLKMKELGGLNAGTSPAMLKLRNQMLAAKRKIEREHWFSTIVA